MGRTDNGPLTTDNRPLTMPEQRIKILLVEDDPDNVWVMRKLLSDRWDAPYEMVNVETALGGDRARAVTTCST